MEFLVEMTTHVPAGTLDDTVDDVREHEAARARELASEGHLLQLWRPARQTGEWRTFGLFAADDPDRLEKLLTSMPLRVWRTDEVTPLSPTQTALPGEADRRRTLGLWRAHDAASLAAILESLPLYGWMTIETTPLTVHPNDPDGKRLKRPR